MANAARAAPWQVPCSRWPCAAATEPTSSGCAGCSTSSSSAASTAWCWTRAACTEATAGYARSLAVLARAKDAGLVTKSGLILGMGERDDEVRAALGDLRAVGVDIVTLGQYLQPSAQHLPIARWWTPAEFDAVRAEAEAMGFAHVEAGPLVRSSYHAREGIDQLVVTAG